MSEKAIRPEDTPRVKDGGGLQIHEMGPLFEEIQRAKIFEDDKTFVDSTPRRGLQAILAEYELKKGAARAFNLSEFVRANFALPDSRKDIARHIAILWDMLRRDPEEALPGSSLLPLPEPHVVPGGRFREIYYWDSYFIMLGLRTSGRHELINSMLRNFAYLIASYGHIPNGNRSYYLSRSQPPFFSLMLELVAEREGVGVFAEHAQALWAEYEYWMDLSPAATGHTVQLAQGVVLNRYYDQETKARPEAYSIDEEIALRANRPREGLMREIRSAAESGWDFSSRWFADGKKIETIRTTEVIPVDLNCLLYQMELTMTKAAVVAGRPDWQNEASHAASVRRAAILRYCWSDENAFFFDYDLAEKATSRQLTLAGVFPLFAKIATPAQAALVATTIKEKFLRPGGLVATLCQSGQQWDAPNGWAPLHWVAVQGLENYGYRELAQEIARRWVNLNRDVYIRTGRLMEKYDVVDLTAEAGGGEYPTQDGFGWTNGVLIALLQKYR